MAKFRLRNLSVDEGSLVDAPANPEAQVVLFKRDKTKTPVTKDASQAKTFKQAMDEHSSAMKLRDVMSLGRVFEQCAESIMLFAEGPERKKLLAKSVEEFAAELSRMAPDLAKRGTKEKTMADENVDVSEILKSLPEPVRKMLEDNKAAIEKAQKDVEAAGLRAEQAENVAKAEKAKRELAEFTKRAGDELADLNGDAAEKGRLMKAISDGLSADDAGKVFEMLKGASEQVKSAKTIGKVIGSDARDGSAGDAWSKIEAKAKALVDSKVCKTNQEAVAKIAKDEPELYAEYVNEQN